MPTTVVSLAQGHADGYVISLGPFNLVFAVTKNGMVGCGAFDVATLDKFSYPAARVTSTSGAAIATIDDLLSGTVRETNAAARSRGITIGMTGREALERM